jgi:hypothetical protein
MTVEPKLKKSELLHLIKYLSLRTIAHTKSTIRRRMTMMTMMKLLLVILFLCLLPLSTAGTTVFQNGVAQPPPMLIKVGMNEFDVAEANEKLPQKSTGSYAWLIEGLRTHTLLCCCCCRCRLPLPNLIAT